MMLLLYNILFPIVFIFFIPGILIKLIRRPGDKANYMERFALFSMEKKELLGKMERVVWVHAVSVGETMIALDMIKKWKRQMPERSFVLSTTTTTGQALANSRRMEDMVVIYCPLDFIPFVKRTISLVRPSMLVIFETEIWPNMINRTVAFCGKVVLVNARMSDKSVKGYCRFRGFFRPLLEKLNVICVQTDDDLRRFKAVAPSAEVSVNGNMKFDQEIPLQLPECDLERYFGKKPFNVLLAASTHPGEERLIADTFNEIKTNSPDWKLVIVPRHAERGSEIAALLETAGMSFYRKTSTELPNAPVECLLADTTGEMLGFMDRADIVIMGKSLAGQKEGHNLIEPALLAKAIITGDVLTNFRFVLNTLRKKDAIITVSNDSELAPALARLIKDVSLREEMGRKAKDAIVAHKGATTEIIKMLEKIFNE